MAFRVSWGKTGPRLSDQSLAEEDKKTEEMLTVLEEDRICISSISGARSPEVDHGAASELRTDQARTDEVPRPGLHQIVDSLKDLRSRRYRQSSPVDVEEVDLARGCEPVAVQLSSTTSATGLVRRTWMSTRTRAWPR